MVKKLILITTLAEYQTTFWIEVGREIIKNGIEVAFISFDDRSTDLLLKNNFTVYHAKSNKFSTDYSDEALVEAIKDLKISNFAFWSSHERITFDINDDQLRIKFIECKMLVDQAFYELQKKYNNQIILVQELGGFISVVVSYFTARKCGITNWFIEPSFFREKLFFLKNSFSAAKITTSTQVVTSKEVLMYLSQAQKYKSIVIPKKDKHQYTSPISKLLSKKNFVRLFTKIIDKYIFGKKHQFSYIGHHVYTHVRMLCSSVLLKNKYTRDYKLNNLIYYPLHVPCDMALTIRSPEYLDQVSLIEFILRNLPDKYMLAIKEHPAMIGAVDARRLILLKKQYKNLIIFHPEINNYDVLEAADLVISINSKAGAEALILRKPVLVLGDAFYKNSPFVYSINSLSELRIRLHKGIKTPKNKKNFHEIANYFERVWRISYPGELYINDKDNIKVFTKSLIEKVLR